MPSVSSSRPLGSSASAHRELGRAPNSARPSRPWHASGPRLAGCQRPDTRQPGCPVAAVACERDSRVRRNNGGRKQLPGHPGQVSAVTVGECNDTVGVYPLGCSGPRQSRCGWELGVNQDRDSLHAFGALVARLATTADTSGMTAGPSFPAQARGATHGRKGASGAAVPRQHSARGRQRNAAQTTAKGAR